MPQKYLPHKMGKNIQATGSITRYRSMPVSVKSADCIHSMDGNFNIFA
jgi:hypothetical protein